MSKKILEDVLVLHLIEQRLAELPIDFNGHFKCGDVIEVKGDELYIFFEMGIDLTKVSSPDLIYLVAMLDKVDIELDQAEITKAKRFVEIYKKQNGIRCSECGQTLQLETDGTVLRAKNVCPYPEGMTSYSFQIEIKSGRIAISRNMNKWFPVNFSRDMLKCLPCDFKVLSEQAAQEGFLCFYFGRDNPDVFQMEKSVVKLVQLERPESENIDTDIINYSDYEWKKALEFGKYRGSIQGIGNWIWFCDFDIFLERFGRDPKKIKDSYLTLYGVEEDIFSQMVVVNVEPGIYEFTHQYHTVCEQDGNVTFTNIKKV